jgi:NAD-dependent SIR2 family protein deacetylase
MMSATATPHRPPSVEPLATFVERHPRLFVLTGVGCSTDSGIPDYRGVDGRWKRRQPVMFQDFVRHEPVRRRYWARSLLGWPRFGAARPNGAHHALARLEEAGFVRHLVTQNVDRLHQRAGSRRVTDLHGRLDRVVCLDCNHTLARSELQQELETLNPGFSVPGAAIAPDGDADLDAADLSDFRVPACPHCGGVLKPAVVFFGECVPAATVEETCQYLAASDAVLVIGSSLMVYSGLRFARAAAEAGKPIAAVNLGRTRADELFCLKVEAPCARVLETLATVLLSEPEAADRGSCRNDVELAVSGGS